MKLKTTEFIALLLTALVTGVFWGTWFTLTRSLDKFAPAEFIHIGKTIIANVAVCVSLCWLLYFSWCLSCGKATGFINLLLIYTL